MSDLIIDRVKKIADKEGITLYKLEKDIDASKGVLSKAYRNKTEISSKWLSRISEKYPLYNPSWILTGKENIHRTIEKKQQIPVYASKAQAGIGAMFQEFLHTNPIDYIQVPHIHNADAAIFSFGDSMLPLINSGDLLVYKQFQSIDSIMPGKIYILSFRLEDEIITVVKYLFKGSTENTVSLVSENAFYQPMEIPKDSIKSFARVLCTVRYNN